MKRFTVLMAVVFAFFSAQLYSQPHDAKMVKNFMEKLNLTEAQKKDVEKIHADAEKQSIAQKAKVETAQVELEQLCKADSPDKSAIEKKINEISDQQGQMKMIRVNSWFAINKLLNPDQQKTWKKALQYGQAIGAHRQADRMMKRHMRTPHSGAPTQIPHGDTPAPESE